MRVWLKVNVSNVEYVGCITEGDKKEVGMTEAQVIDDLLVTPKFVLEYPHILIQRPTQGGLVQICPFPLYDSKDTRPDYRRVMIITKNVELIMVMDPQSELILALEQQEGLTSIVIADKLMDNTGKIIRLDADFGKGNNKG